MFMHNEMRVLKCFNEVATINFESIPENQFWNTGDEKELLMHRVHSYPAKFPAFITKKALEFAKDNSVDIDIVADIFCGCGTVAFEARRHNIDFWGCDINPVATMIAKVKSRNYNTKILQKYLAAILEAYYNNVSVKINFKNINPRLLYWYNNEQIEDLSGLKISIEEKVPYRSIYRTFFTCAFSNILKPTSKWLAKSIKPQIDPNKAPSNVIEVFQSQCKFMIKANAESDIYGPSCTKIVDANFLAPSLKRPTVNMIITSPPYVTSYEYADLHQLSSLWLNYADDYRDLREGSIGSLHHIYNFDRELKRLNKTGNSIVFRLIEKDRRKARSVAKYFLDMQQTSNFCYNMLVDNGIALFVIGNTEYKGIKIENARHLAESLLNSGFASVSITKRKVSGKILTPYRDDKGRFANDSNNRKVYAEEFIVIGRKQ